MKAGDILVGIGLNQRFTSQIKIVPVAEVVIHPNYTGYLFDIFSYFVINSFHFKFKNIPEKI